MRILLAGFEPCAGRSLDPSWEAARQLDGEVIAGAWVHAIQLPVRWRESVAAIASALDREPVGALLIGGLSFGRAAIDVEALARAVADAPWTPDDAGRSLANERTDGDPSGPDALLATAPVRAIVAALNDAGIPAVVSWDGGTHVSNATLYGALRHARDHGLNLRTTSLQVPALPELTTGTAAPSLPLAAITEAFRIACRVVATHEGPDVRARRWPTALPALP